MPPKRKKNVINQESSSKRSKHSDENISSMQKYFKSALNCGNVNAIKPHSFSPHKCETWFYKYAEKSSSKVIGPKGVEVFCKDLQVIPEDIVTLVIAWKLDAENMGYFKLSEWKAGMSSLECDNMSKLKSKLDYLRGCLKDASSFKKIYRYAFDFARDKDQKSLDINTGKAMLQLLLRNTCPYIDEFIQFLNQSKYKIINRDQWNSSLEFMRTVSTSEFLKYDDTGAWPVMLDEFVEWYQGRHKMSDIQS